MEVNAYVVCGDGSLLFFRECECHTCGAPGRIDDWQPNGGERERAEKARSELVRRDALPRYQNWSLCDDCKVKEG